jgi:4-hydroxy-tetrahydrodipicolinate synthase
MRRPFTGVGTALVTPFRRDGSLDEAAVKRLARRQIDAGVHFLSPCGTTGEAPTLNHREKLRVVELVLEEAKGHGVPVLAGAGGYDTREVIELARDMERVGADGVLSVTPYYNKPTPEGLYQHFKAIAESTHVPIVLYNVPSRTGINLDVKTTVRLAEIPNIVGIKAPGDLVQMSEIISGTREDFIVLSGDDPVTVAAMAVGGAGVVSVASNEAPTEMVQIVELCERGDYAAARKLHHWLLPLLQVNFAESNPIPCKAAMAAMGLLEENYRLPMVPPSAATRDKVMSVLQQLKMLGAAARVL